MSTPSLTSATGPLDVQGLVSQLMTVADQPINRMNSQLQVDKSQISDYGSINSDLTAFQSALNPLSSGQFINTFKASSSDTNVLSATATSSAMAGDYSVTVANLASAQNVALSSPQASATDSLGNSADTLDFTFGRGSTATVDISADSSLQQISDAIDAAGIGVSADVVKVDNSTTPYRLVLTGNDVGSGSSFSTSTASGQSGLSFLDFNAASAVDAAGNITDKRLTAVAQDANLTVNGLALTSGSNTVSDVINGVSLNLTQVGTTSLKVAMDSSAVQAQVQSFVTAYNKVQADATNLYQGDLKGDFTLVSLQNMFDGVLNAPISGANGTTEVAYLAQVGVSLQKDGSLSLDSAALNTAISNNAAAVSNVFGNSNNDGFAQRFNALVNSFLGPQGLVTTRTTTLNQQVSDQNKQIDQEQTRLDTLQAGYLTQYSSLNSALAQMEQTSSSLAAMISSA